MIYNHHRTERLNVTNAARQLRMSVPALGARIQRGDVRTEHIAGYTFIPVDEVKRVAAAIKEEARVAEVAEQEQAEQERQERDGAHVVRLITEAQQIAAKYGYAPPGEG